MGKKLIGPLAVVRDVFEGRISRDDLIHRPPLTRVFVAVAVMLAFPEHYFGEARQLKGDIGLVLNDIITAGKSPRVAGRRLPFDYAKISDDASLHTLYGRGVGRVAVITPPPRLIELVEELGVTPEIQQFQVEVAAATAERRRREDMALALHSDDRAYVNWVIARVHEEGGEPLLRTLLDALHYQVRRGS